MNKEPLGVTKKHREEDCVGQKIVAIVVAGDGVVDGNVHLLGLRREERGQLRNLTQRLGLKLHGSEGNCCITTDSATTGKVRLEIRHNTTAKKPLRKDRNRFIKLLRSRGFAVTLCRQNIHTNGDDSPCYQHTH